MYLEPSTWITCGARVLMLPFFFTWAGKATKGEYETEKVARESQGTTRKSGGEGLTFFRGKVCDLLILIHVSFLKESSSFRYKLSLKQPA